MRKLYVLFSYPLSTLDGNKSFKVFTNISTNYEEIILKIFFVLSVALAGMGSILPIVREIAHMKSL
jgi:hypothetical protein